MDTLKVQKENFVNLLYIEKIFNKNLCDFCGLKKMHNYKNCAFYF